MRRLPLCLLLCATLAAAQEPPHVGVAKKFLRAFDAQDSGTMAVLAAQPASRVAYSLVLYSLLEGREYDAAKQLAQLRASAPEGEGLLRLARGYAEGVRASDEQRAASHRAEAQLVQGDPAAALRTLDAVPAPVEGTITGARMEWTRARCLAKLDKAEPAAAAFASCARLARTTGWLQLAAESEKNRLLIARSRPTMADVAMEAATALVQDTRAIDDRLGELNACMARAALYLRAGRPEEARADYAVAIDRARTLEKRELEGQLLTNLAYVYHVVEHQPRRAKRFYIQGLDVFVKLGDAAAIAKARFNVARVLTDTADYAEALAQLAEAESLEGAPAELLRPIRTQRAYILRRQGMLDASRDAYVALLESAPTPAEKTALELELGELQLLRGDFARARDHFQAATAAGSRAWAGEAAAWGGLEQVERCRERFGAAIERAAEREAKGRLRLQWAAFERSFGFVDRAIELAEAAKSDLAREESTDYGNAAASWVVLGDLYLLDNRIAPALDALAKASVFLFQLRDPARAIPAYARETLVLMGQEGKVEEATQRHGTLLHIAEGVSDPRLKSMAACVDAVFLQRSNKPDESVARFEEALRLAEEADDAELQATALATRALFAGAAGLPFARRAIELLDREPDRVSGRQPLVVGERPDDAPSIALRCLLDQETPDPALAFELAERIKARRLRLALRGRDAILVRTLPEADYRRYVDARGALREARVAGKGVEAARAAFVELAGKLPAPLALASVPGIRPVQDVLAADEILLLYVDDPYARGVVAVQKNGVAVRRFEADKQLEGLADLIANKRRILIAPDGFFALAPRPGQEIRYVASAASLLAQRRAEAAKGGMVAVPGPVRIDLRHPAATDAWPRAGAGGRVVILDSVELIPGDSVDGYVAATAARLAAGADVVLVSLTGKSDPRLVARFRDHLKSGATPGEALRLTQEWAQTVEGLKERAQWASLVLWGARG